MAQDRDQLEQAMRLLISEAKEAALTLRDLLGSKDESIRLQAAQAILEFVLRDYQRDKDRQIESWRE